jgi:hypothetical protein
MATDASQICPGQQRDAEALSEKWQAPEDQNRWVT